MLTDPIADMLTRIRNALAARKTTVDVPWSRQKEALAGVLVREGYLEAASAVESDGRKRLRVGLRYDARRRPVIAGIKRVSRPSLRVYVGVRDIPIIRRGLGVSVLSTPRGLLVDREARREKVGGEVVCSIW
jgi:small subunit ribosomal protein S8